MSHHEPDHDHEQHAEAHADDHHEPPPPEEPKTPAWLTVLGVSLFLVAGIWFLATRPAAKTVEELRPAPAASAEPAASAAQPVRVAPADDKGPPGRPDLKMFRPTRPAAVD